MPMVVEKPMTAVNEMVDHVDGVHVTDMMYGNRTRKSFAKINEVLETPNLIEVQKKSYDWFITKGLQEVFEEISEITDFNGKLVLDFIGFKLEKTPKYTIEQCKKRDTTYEAPLRVTARLQNKETGEVKTESVFMGNFPLMTDSGTFVFNGAERVIVSQLVRSPGVYFSEAYDKNGKKLYTSTINPNRGAWLEYETDSNDFFQVRIDKNRKLPITVLIKALLMLRDDVSVEDLNADFTVAMTGNLGSVDEIHRIFNVPDENGGYLEDHLIDATLLNKDTTKNGEEALQEIYRKLRPGEPPTIESAVKHIVPLLFDPHRYDLSRVGRYKYNKKLAIAARIKGHTLARDVINEETGEVLAFAGEHLSADKAMEIQRAGISTVYLDVIDPNVIDPNGVHHRIVKVFSNGMVNIEDFIDITPEEKEECGINEMVRLSILKDIMAQAGDDHDALITMVKDRAVELIPRIIIIDDIFASINYLTNLCYEVGTVDDIDHLGNRRIRSVGELLQNQFRIGFTRMERVIKEKISLQSQENGESITPTSLINIRPITAAIKEFFGSSPLSQFMDQNNPLAELTHKRRLSALGPGGLSRDRAGFEVRDVHYTHYGRMCPIETPEGPNIGLISYLSTFARINEYGFVEAPYRKVDKATGKILDEVVYMPADVEDNYIVAQANEPLTEEGTFARKKVNARYRDEILEIERERVDYMDVSPKMLVSIATAMIPFLENDDANRALMGANMQRQAVPLLKTEAPIVGTGMEYKAGVDSGAVVVSRHNGVVTRVSADEVVLDVDGEKVTYDMIKFLRSNQGTCINQKPIVSKGQIVKAGDVLADGPSTDGGEISLGKNALIGFMTWEGYNYEDAVLINEKLVRDDVYTSIHIEEHKIEARDTKLGPEEITREIPNVGAEALANLDEHGIIRIGAEVRSGDILVGKVTPKGETELTAEEKLLRAIFGEKAREVRDTSLRVPHGEYGIVVDVQVLTRDNTNTDELGAGVNEVIRCYIAQKRKLSVGDKMAGRHGNKGVVSRILPQEDMPFLPDGTPLDIVLNPLGVPSRMNIGQVLEVNLAYACKALGWHIATPVFDGAHESDIQKLLAETGKSIDGKTYVYDGRTGERFDNPVTVGYMYYLKLHHLVDDKIHARSIGPYSMVTQQPLGGKAQFGGQRFGEMEVWALEAYGAAYTLQEILTVKSDDVEGRVKTYEAIVKGQNVPTPGVPESFKVLIKELQSLGLDMRVLDEEGEEIDLSNHYDDDDTGLGENTMPLEYVDDKAYDGYTVTDADENEITEDVEDDSLLDLDADDSYQFDTMDDFDQ